MATCSEHTERDSRNSTGNFGRTSPDNQSRSIERVTENFEGKPATRVFIDGAWWFGARALGRIAESSNDGKRFGRNVVEGDGEDGRDYRYVEGDDAGRVRVALSSMVTGGAESAPPVTTDEFANDARSLLLLSESGLYLALLSCRSDTGKRMRRWLAREVLPSIRRTGSYTAPNTSGAELAELRERINVLEAGGSNGGVIGEWFAQTRIIRPLRYAASLRAAVNGCSFKSAYRSLLNLLEREARYGKGGELWRSFPAAPERVSSVLAFVQRTVTVAEREHRAWQKTRPAGQASLFDHFAA